MQANGTALIGGSDCISPDDPADFPNGTPSSTHANGWSYCCTSKYAMSVVCRVTASTGTALHPPSCSQSHTAGLDLCTCMHHRTTTPTLVECTAVQSKRALETALRPGRKHYCQCQWNLVCKVSFCLGTAGTPALHNGPSNRPASPTSNGTPISPRFVAQYTRTYGIHQRPIAVPHTRHTLPQPTPFLHIPPQCDPPACSS